jgi:hypothetical protein
MKAYVGAGWYIWHITDRNVQLRKSDPIYRKLTGLDGFVNYSAQPGYDKGQMLDEAIQKAKAEDEKLAFLVAQDIIPRGSKVQNYQMKAHRLNKGFRTPEDASVIGRKAL